MSDIGKTYHEILFLFVWYSVELVFMLSVIAYVLYTFKWYNPAAIKEDVPATMNDTWSQTSTIVGNLAQITKQVSAAFKGEEEVVEKSESKPKKESTKKIKGA